MTSEQKYTPPMMLTCPHEDCFWGCAHDIPPEAHRMLNEHRATVHGWSRFTPSAAPPPAKQLTSRGRPNYTHVI